MAKKKKDESAENPRSAAKKSAKTAKKTVKKAATKKKATKKKAATKKKTTTKKTAAKKKTTKKTATKKAAAKKKTTKKAVAKKVTRKTARKATAAKAPSKEVSAPKRRGQLVSEQARFDLGAQEAVFEKALGTPPPGYHLTIVRGWIRSPGRIVAAWDVNDDEALDQVERAGWDAFCLRVLDQDENALRHVVLGQRSGTWHIELEPRALTVRLVIGIQREDGFFQTLARSGAVRLPPAEPQAEAAPEFLSLDLQLDRRDLLSGELPPIPGHQAEEGPAGERLRQRVRIAVTHGPESLVERPAPDVAAAREAVERTAQQLDPSKDEDAQAGPPSASGAQPDGFTPHLPAPGRKPSPLETSLAEEHEDSHPTSPRRWQGGAPSSHEVWGPTSPSRPFSNLEKDGDD